MDVASIALSEYRFGVVDGRVVRAEELNEARLFLSDARRMATDLSEPARHVAVAHVDRLIAGVTGFAPEDDLRDILQDLRDDLSDAVGAALDQLPAGPPSLVRGADLFERYCIQCHGASGTGDGPAAAALLPPPADLTDRQRLRRVPLVEFFRRVNVGVAGTAMPGFDGRLDAEDRWSVALYAASLRFPGVTLERGRSLVARCFECTVFASDFAATAGLSDDSIASIIRALADADADEASMAALAAYGRVAGATEQLGNDRQLAVARTAGRSRQMVDRAVAQARSGDRAAAQRMALDGYLAFEGIETAVRARDARAARRVEAAFSQFRAAVGASSDPERLRRATAEVIASLDDAVNRVSDETSAASLFSQSFIIMLREGLEAILIVGALVVFLCQAGARERKRDIGVGVVAAVVASLLTAAAFATVLRTSAAHQELVEGLTMVLAALVLFWVSYWLVSKIEVRRWQGFVRARMRQALVSKRSWALAGVGFLAVYREGFETVLFYAALFATSDRAIHATVAILAGIGLGMAVLGAVFYGMQRYGVRIPLKPFFALTSALLYVMAFSFAGQGVAELQSAGVVTATPLDWLPAIPALGIFPTMQTLLSQLAFAAALGGALLWVFWLEPRLAEAKSAG